MRRRLVIVMATVALVAAACGSDESASTTTSTTVVTTSTVAPPTTAAAPATSSTTITTTTTIAATTTATAAPATLADAGPYPVGVTTLTLPSGAPVEVWYPSAVAPTGEVTYDVRDEVPPAVRDLLTADVPAGYSFPGTRDAPVADGTFPLVLFSHGFSGIRQQSTFLTSHLASWGMIVAAPEHTSRDLSNVLAGTASGDNGASVDDLLATLDLMTTATGTAGDRFDGHVDTSRVGAVGHSAGGWTVLSAAADPRIAGYVSLASGGPRDGEPYPAKPSLFMAGAIDGIVPVDTVTRPAFAAAPSPASFVELDATGHNGFDDFCTFGNGTGIIGLAEASGLGPLLDAQPQLRTLGEDGCIPPAAPVEQAFPVIRQATTSFLQSLFGQDGATTLGVTGTDTVAVTTDSH